MGALGLLGGLLPIQRGKQKVSLGPIGGIMFVTFWGRSLWVISPMKSRYLQGYKIGYERPWEYTYGGEKYHSPLQTLSNVSSNNVCRSSQISDPWCIQVNWHLNQWHNNVTKLLFDQLTRSSWLN